MSTTKEMRAKRKLRIRAKVSGTPDRPRLVVHRSHTTLSVQLVDDMKGHTLAAARVRGKNTAAAKTLGSQIARIAKQKKITSVVFDRGGYRYHGAVQALADAAREGGLHL